MTNEERRTMALMQQMEAQKKDYERQIAQLKMQNEILKKQLETQKQRNDHQSHANHVLAASSLRMRNEISHLNRQVNAYQSRVF